MEFLNDNHKERFEKLMLKGNISKTDKERYIGMYVISGDEYLFDKIEDLYNFDDRCYIVDFVEDKLKFKRDLSTSEKAIMTFAFDIFTGENNIGINDLFSVLDIQNRQLILNAIKYRYIR